MLLTTWPEKSVLFLDRAKERGGHASTGAILTPVGVTPEVPAPEDFDGVRWVSVMHMVMRAMSPAVRREGSTSEWFMRDGYNYRVLVPMPEMEPFWEMRKERDAKPQLPDGLRLVTLWEIDQVVLAGVLANLVRAREDMMTKLSEIAEQLRTMR